MGRINEQKPTFEGLDVDIYLRPQVVGSTARELTNSLGRKVAVLENPRDVAVARYHKRTEPVVEPAGIVAAHLREDGIGVVIKGSTEKVVIPHRLPPLVQLVRRTLTR